jgi:hypothetical protein
MEIKTVRDMEVMLCEVLENMTPDDESLKYAREVANFSGKLMKMQSNSMAYCELHGKKQVLPFMERED